MRLALKNSMSLSNKRVTLTEKEFCPRVGISRVTAWRLRNAGKLSFCRIGGKIMYLERHVEEFLKNNERRGK